MPNILILGGTGYTGKLIAQLLLEHSEAEITLATRHADKAQVLADELNQKFQTQRLRATYADAADKASLLTAFDAQDLVVVAAPTTAYADEVVQAALEAGVDYLDVQLSAKKLALLKSQAGEIQRAGRCFITEAGFHPGLLSALVRFTGRQPNPCTRR